MMRLSNLFLNRWMALVWAAGIIWFALDFTNPGTPSADGKHQVITDITGAEVTKEQVNEIGSIINGI